MKQIIKRLEVIDSYLEEGDREKAHKLLIKLIKDLLCAIEEEKNY